MRKLTAAFVLSLAALAPLASGATVIVTAIPAAPSVGVGETVTVELLAQFGPEDLVLAWGLDLVLDPALVAMSGAPTLGASWLGFATPDGDGLGGVALEGITGTHRLATLALEGLAPGLVELGFATTPRDRTEGFALDPTGFASGVVFQGASLEVVPEPRVLAFALLASAALLRHGARRMRHGARGMRRGARRRKETACRPLEPSRPSSSSATDRCSPSGSRARPGATR
jgi:hypothetical protein